MPLVDLWNAPTSKPGNAPTETKPVEKPAPTQAPNPDVSKIPTTQGPSPDARQEQKARVTFTLNFADPDTGTEVKDFPLAYIIGKNNPYLYVEVLKLYGLVPKDVKLVQLIQPDDKGTSRIQRINAAIFDAIDKQLVPVNPDYANLKAYFINYLMQLVEKTQKTNPSGAPAKAGAIDMMDYIKNKNLEVMGDVNPDSKAWDAIKGRVLQYNHNNQFADEDGTSDPVQQKNIDGNEAIIRSIIIGVKKALGLM